MKRLILIAKSSETKEVLLGQLKEYFEPYCQVEGYLLDAEAAKPDKADMLIYSSPSIRVEHEAKTYIPPKVPVWVVNRLFDPMRLKWLMQIPGGTEVLVINNLLSTCKEVIQTLQEAGMDHLTYIPCYPGSLLDEEKSYRYAITLGQPDVVPPESAKLIDVGIRHIHIHDLIELGRRLGVPLERERDYLCKFITGIHTIGKELGRSFADIQKLHTHLQSILEAVQEPIFAVDQEGTITFLNQLAADLFDCDAKSVIGRTIQEIPRVEAVLPFLDRTSVLREALISLKGNEFIVHCKQMEWFSEYQGTVCMLKNVTEMKSLERRLRKEITVQGHVALYTFEQIAGRSPALTNAIMKAKKMAKGNSNILITGENGTGKELFAHAIHLESHRRNGPFVAINCASLPENLLESEIFGYDEGAFTGARKGGKPGVFEMADGGTIFLDEIGDISPAIQVRLLRVLQEKQVVRVGATKVLTVDVRVIAATNKNLEEEVRNGKFREDLYYRLNVLPIHVPPLRQRKEDIPLLLELHQRNLGERCIWSEEVMELFMNYDWPGNVRELLNVVEYALTVNDSGVITPRDVPEKLLLAQKDGSWTSGSQTDDGLDPEEREIIRVLYQYSRQNRVVGRYELVKRPELKALGLTEQRLRTRLKKLEQRGLVAIGSTKQGSRLTEMGKQLALRWEKDD